MPNQSPPQAIFTTIQNIEQARALYEYWQGLAEGKPRRSVDPVAIGAAILPRLNLVSSLNGVDFRYDLIGEELQSFAPRLKPGSLATDILSADPTRTYILEQFKLCAAEPRPRAYRTEFVSIDEIVIAMASIIFPLDILNNNAGSMLIAVWPGKSIDSIHFVERYSEKIDDVQSWLFGK